MTDAGRSVADRPVGRPAVARSTRPEVVRSGWRAVARGGWAVGPTIMSIAASGISAAATLVVARGIGAAAFGQFTLVISIALIISVGSLLSLNYVMYQELPRAEPAERPALMTTALFTALVLGAGLVALGALAGPLLAAALGIDARTLWFSIALALAMTANLLTDSFLRGLHRYRLVAGLKLAVAVAYLLAVAVARLVAGIHDAGWYLTALIAMNVVFAAAATLGFTIEPRRWSPALARSLCRHGGWVTAIGALTAVLFGVDVLFLNHWSSRADVGVYSVYNGFPKRLLGVVFTEGIGLVLLPTLALLDKPSLLRRIGRLAPAVFAAAATCCFAASTGFFALLRAQYPYSVGLMALASLGIGVHTVFNLYFFALSMDGVRGAKVFAGCLAAGAPAALAGQALLIARWDLTGALIAFPLSNLVLVGAVLIGVRRTYRLPRTTSHVEPEVRA